MIGNIRLRLPRRPPKHHPAELLSCCCGGLPLHEATGYGDSVMSVPDVNGRAEELLVVGAPQLSPLLLHALAVGIMRLQVAGQIHQGWFRLEVDNSKLHIEQQVAEAS